MATISKIQGALDPRLTGQVADTTRSQPDHPAPPSRQELPESRDSLDPEKLQALVDKLQESLDQASAEPHEVGFRQDPRTEAFVIEIKNPEGRVIKQFPPEKVLNLQDRMDELSGMVIDRMT